MYKTTPYWTRNKKKAPYKGINFSLTNFEFEKKRMCEQSTKSLEWGCVRLARSQTLVLHALKIKIDFKKNRQFCSLT